MQVSSVTHNFENKYHEGIVTKCLINETFDQIFPYINGCGMSINLVCGYWNTKIIAVERDKLSILNDFRKCSMGLLYLGYIDADVNIDPLKLVEMVRFRHSINAIKQCIVSQLMDLSDEAFSGLETKTKDVVKSTFLENVFSLTRLYKELDVLLIFKSENIDKIKSICKGLVKANEIAKVIEVAMLFKTNYFFQYEIKMKIGSKLFRDGDFIEALNIVHPYRRDLCEMVTKELILQNNPQKVVEFAKIRPAKLDYYEKIEANINLEQISRTLKSNRKFEEALEVIKLSTWQDAETAQLEYELQLMVNMREAIRLRKLNLQ